MKQFHKAALTFAGLFGSILRLAQPAARSPIFPVPREITNSGKAFVLDEQVTVAVPDQPSSQDLFLARMLTEELGDRFRLAVPDRLNRVRDFPCVSLRRMIINEHRFQGRILWENGNDVCRRVLNLSFFATRTAIYANISEII